MALTAAQRRSRLAFDWEVSQAMNGEVIHAVAYRTTADLEAQRNPITSLADAGDATKYRVDFHVPTLVAAGRFVPVTTIGFDLDTGDYPISEPATWIVSDHTPWSPHFRRGSPVCLGELWTEAKGNMLLGQLFVHIAKLLNFDERRRPGYAGWNGEAIAWHKQHYGDSPLTPHLRYPALPVHLTHGVAPSAGLFEPVSGGAAALFSATSAPATNHLFGARTPATPSELLFGRRM
jgi:hypothetical protein